MAYAGGKGKCISPDLLVQTDTPVGFARSNRARSTNERTARMYSVNRLTHEAHGPVVVVERAENGNLSTPFQAVQRALTERRLWKESGVKNIRFLIDDQLLTSKQAERWASEEYKSLPKCKACAKILDGDVHSHRLCRSGLFCSKDCADKDYLEEVEKLKDEEEIEYL